MTVIVITQYVVCSVAVSLNVAGLRNVLQLCKRMSKLEVSSLLFTYLLILIADLCQGSHAFACRFRYFVFVLAGLV